MTDKITIERETLERLVRWIGGSRAIIETDLFNDLRAALAAQPAEPVTWMPIESSPKDGAWMYVWRKHGTFPIQAKYSIKYAWFEDDDANHLYNLTHWMPLPAAPGVAPVPPDPAAEMDAVAPPDPAAVPLTKEQRELFDLILHHYGPDKRLQPLRDLIAAAGDKP